MGKILILGGTNFIGRNLVEGLLKTNKYQLTLINRGKTNSHLFPNVEKRIGNRNEETVTELIKGHWDYIIDVSCYFPKSLSYILKSITSDISKYIFVSTCSVYQNTDQLLKDEKSPTLTYEDNQLDDSSNHSYGQRKKACEDLLVSSGLNYTIFRPALVYGQYDHTDRFYYWLHQVKEYDHILMPNYGNQKFSITYVKDLVQLIISSIHPSKDNNIYNAISHPEASISQIVNCTKHYLNIHPDLSNISSSKLSKHNIAEWVDMPLWINSDYFTFSNKKILSNFSKSPTSLDLSIGETIKLRWPKPSYGISRAKQLQLLGD